MNQQIDQVRVDLPSYEDLKGAASALMRLQDTYQLDTSSVAQGDLAGLESPVLSGRPVVMFCCISSGACHNNK